MNIFVVDEHPTLAANQMIDKHVVKMILESGQMLSTAHRVLDGDEWTDYSKNGRRIKRWRLSDEREGRLWKASFVNHPCTRWVMESLSNYQWLSVHGLALAREYTRRYGRTHASESLMKYLVDNHPTNIADKGLTKFAQAMPDEYKNEDAVTAYRAYYKGEKSGFAKWTKVPEPEWWTS
mgnify:CR=1 FL=1|tara:strand:- start:392 stop:928 length:537 start_codon:yes stop_codon:yes gene_type:complete